MVSSVSTSVFESTEWNKEVLKGDEKDDEMTALTVDLCFRILPSACMQTDYVSPVLR